MSDTSEITKKTPMTDEERLALCQKLDQELDDFINSLEKKRYTDGWPEDRWEEEMDKHPFFMKTVPEDGQLSPLAEGLAKLKYDPEENTPIELANSYKEDGNFNFKHKNYRLALLGYTEGIKVRCEDAQVNASLYNNRAAAHWYLKNYRSALFDSEKALTFDPGHSKARLRAAKAAYESKKYETCIEHCKNLLEKNNDKDVTELLNKAKKSKMMQERDERKKNRIQSNSNEKKTELIKTIIDRGIKISKCEDEDDIDLSKLEPTLPGAHDSIVYLKDGVLMWPILFLYPEHQMTDFVRGCPENAPLRSQLEQVFPAPWDADNKYTCDSVNVYYEGYDKMPHIINTEDNLGVILVSKYFELKGGTAAFFILPRGSVIERKYLESHL